MPTDDRSAGNPGVPPQAALAGGRIASAPASGWAEQDDVLRDLWLAGESQQDIADKLGRSVAAVMTRAARLGLPRRFAPGRKPTTKRSMLPKQPREVELQQRRSTAPSAAAQPEAQARPAVERICLMCLTKFPSQGPHNRICASCKDSNSYIAGSRLPDLDFPI